MEASAMKSRIVIAVATILIMLPGIAFGAAKAEPPKITSIKFSAPSPLKAGDTITVEMTGTPGCNAAFGVKDFIGIEKMQEVSQGIYKGTAVVPKDKIALNAPLVGYLGKDGVHAPPMQASRLINVTGSGQQKQTAPPLGFAQGGVVQPDKLPKPEPAPKEVKKDPAPATPAKSAVVVSKPGKVVISSPADGARVRSTLTVIGIADPGSAVRVEVTYSNRLSGILKLAGQVVSQNVTAGKNGEFKMGPVALDGPLSTNGLVFTVKAYYPDRTDHGTALIKVKQ
jgi:hypothetical protein